LQNHSERLRQACTEYDRSAQPDSSKSLILNKYHVTLSIACPEPVEGKGQSMVF